MIAVVACDRCDDLRLKKKWLMIPMIMNAVKIFLGLRIPSIHSYCCHDDEKRRVPSDVFAQSSIIVEKMLGVMTMVMMIIMMKI
jgi:hypothetical protein